MLWVKITLMLCLFFAELCFKFHLTTDSITTITTFLSIAAGAYLTVLVVLFGSRISVKLNYQQETGTGHSYLDGLCYRLQNSLILCLSTLSLSFIYSFLSEEATSAKFVILEYQLPDIGFILTFLISILFFICLDRTLITAQYLITLLKEESNLNS